MERFKNALWWPLDRLYAVVCGGLTCPYCTFYRGLVFGLLLGGALAGLIALLV